VPPAPFVNAEGGTNGQQIWMLNQATVDSVNLYFANLEQQVGLCNVVKTAVDMGMTRADGTSLLQYDPKIGGSAGAGRPRRARFPGVPRKVRAPQGRVVGNADPG